ncbi:HNH endonuclease [Paludifilum halophilum]|uniref:HNH endonuclease n=1 Tax=Paludifilum halophilum TaxID=1642702 RepID=A0A235B799_9BACL|nr:HNH endonuclease [Paludifilum halophilum]OYD07747.1 hypothetical protein CHM34_09760 [Paludifilum halophilum]
MEGAKAGYDTLSDEFQRVKDELSHGLQAEWDDFKEGSLKEQIKWLLDGFPILGSISGKLSKLTGFDLNQWIVENPGATLLTVLGVGLLFVPLPGAKPLGFSILGGSSVNGVLSGVSGHDVGSSMFYGGLAGIIGLGVGGAVYKGVGSLVGRYAGPFLSKWLPKSLGGGSGAFADLFSFDWMKEGTFNWKKALIGGGVIGALTFGGGLFLDKAVPPLAKAMNQFGWNMEVGGDGTLAMPWIRGADEAADGYRKASGKSGGGVVPKVHPKAGEVREKTKTLTRGPRKGKTVVLHKEVQNYKGEWVTIRGGKRTKKVVKMEDGSKVTVPYEKGFPNFEQWKSAELDLPEQLWLSSDAKQFTYLNKKLYILTQKNPDLGSKFTDDELKLLKRGKTPSRFTWHHHQDKGRMQLVDRYIHSKAGHTGGREIWGGGKERRKGKY